MRIVAKFENSIIENQNEEMNFVDENREKNEEEKKKFVERDET